MAPINPGGVLAPVNRTRKIPINYQRLFQHTFGTHPSTFTKRLKKGFFHNWLGGLPGVCSRGVLKQPLKLASKCLSHHI